MERPRFRTDLVSKPIEENGQRFVDVTDPDSGKTFRFYEVEYAVACAMNGDRGVGELADWARAELGLEPSSTELETVISTLGDLGYLTSNGANLPVDNLELGSPGRSPLDSGQDAAPRAENVELGVAGRSPMGMPSESRPTPANLELGAAGQGDRSTPDIAPSPSPAKTMMGAAPPPQAPSPDLSTNLGEHLSIGTDDVKEAVRQSKIMEAVPVSPDLMHEMEARESQRAPITPPPGATPPGAAPIEMPGRAPGRAPAPEPAPRPIEPPPPKPKSSSSITIILLAALLLVAVGLAAYYFLVYAKDDGTEGTKRPRGANVETPDQPDQTSGKPAPIVATLAAGQATETVVTAPKDGKLSWVEAAGAEVTAGAIIAKYNGFDGVAAKLTAAVQSRDRYKAKLEKATEQNNKRQMAKAAADVERKNGDIAEIQTEAETLVIKAPSAGVVSPVVESGDTVKAEQEVVKLAVATGPSATFTVSSAASFEVGDKIEVADQADTSLTAVCDVTAVEGTSVSIRCPTDSGFTKGTAISVKTP